MTYTTKLLLRLFISGRTASTESTFRELRTYCDLELHAPYELDVVDLLVTPEAAALHNITVTPTLVRELPLPVSRISGDVAIRSRLLELLNFV
jgi:circadian clock protein KaiB